MDIGKIFFILRENDTISRQELYKCGADDDYIQSAVDNEILAPINGDLFNLPNE